MPLSSHANKTGNILKQMANSHTHAYISPLAHKMQYGYTVSATLPEGRNPE